VITDPTGDLVADVGEGIGIATNNVAEYRAAIRGLGLARDLGARRVHVRSDSKLLIEQLAGRWRVKNPTLQVLHAEARALLGTFEEVRLEHVPRERNRAADAMANRGVDEWLAGPEDGYRAPGPDPDLFD
jgi:ribonuclease HI